MRWTHAFSLRLRAAARRRQLDRDLEDELQFHLDCKTRDNLDAGMPREEARAGALRQFGNRTALQEISREMFGLGSLEILARDIRYGWRALRNNLVFTATIVVTLALGIGANTAIFSLIDAVMLRSLPVKAPEQLVSVGDPSRTNTLHNGSPLLDIFSYPLYRQIRERNQVFTDVLAAGRTGRLELNADGVLPSESASTGEAVKGRLVSAIYFDVLGVRAFMGRTFAAEEDRGPGASPVTVISYSYWQRRFASNPEVLGKQVAVNGSKFTIVGIGPRDFFGDVVGVSTDLWLPILMQAQVNPGTNYLERRNTEWLLLMGRLKPGISVSGARASLNVLVHNLVAEQEGSATSTARLQQIRSLLIQVDSGAKGFSALRQHFSQPLLILMGLVGLVLLIACTNVANLLLARATTRQKEIDVRLALGAGRIRLVRQLLTESLLLAGIGSAAGLFLAWWGAGLLLKLGSNDPTSPLPLNIRPDPHTLLFTAAAGLLTGVLFGLAPALRATNRPLNEAFKERSQSLARGGSGWNPGKLLVVAQVALSLLMLVGSGMFARTLRTLETIDVGYRRDGLTMLQVDPIGSGYPQLQAVQASDRLVARLRAVPGVAATSVSEDGIFSGTDASTNGLGVEGYSQANDANRVDHYDRVGPHYFATVGIAMRKGRDFDERDTGTAPKVAIVNESMANFYFAHTDPLGKHLNLGGDKPVSYTIVGVSRDARDHDLKAAAGRRYYLPYFEETDDAIDGFNFEIRTTADAAAIVGGVRNAVNEFDRNLKVVKLATAASMIGSTISDERLIAQFSGMLGALALLLAAAGLYGVITYATLQRSAEIGLRMALGANRGSVVWMVLREALLLALAGIALGIPAALALSKLVEHNVVGLSTADPTVLAIAALVMTATAIVAGLVPAARAARTDPMVALR